MSDKTLNSERGKMQIWEWTQEQENVTNIAARVPQSLRDDLERIAAQESGAEHKLNLSEIIRYGLSFFVSHYYDDEHKREA
jgi:hypothetical protein